MALIPCSSCEELISDKADMCPHCYASVSRPADIVVPERMIRLADLWATYVSLMSTHWTSLALKYAAYSAVAMVAAVVLTVAFYVMNVGGYNSDFQTFVWATLALICWVMLVFGAPTVMWVFLRQEFGFTEQTGIETFVPKIVRASLALAPIILAIIMGSAIFIIPGYIIGAAFWCAPYYFVHENRAYGDAFNSAIALFKLHTNTMLAAFVISALVIPGIALIFGVTLGYLFVAAMGSVGGFFSSTIGLIAGFLVWTWTGTAITAFVHPHVVVYAEDTRSAPVARAPVRQDAPVQRQSAPVAAPSADASPQARLESLNGLREAGLINDDDYERKKLEILSDL